MNQMGIEPRAISSLFHGTTVTTNALLQRKFEGLGLVVTNGFRFLLEIARQSVPDNYGNSYFWVKPERIVPLHFVQEVDERLDPNGKVLKPLSEKSATRVARWFKKRGFKAWPSASSTPTRTPGMSRRSGDLQEGMSDRLYFSVE